MDDILLEWHDTPEEIIKIVSDVVMDDLRVLCDNLSKPENLAFHHIFLGNEHTDPLVFVWGERGSPAFHCRYVKDPEWT